MQFIDLKSQFALIEDDVIARVESVLKSQRYIMGPEIGELEQALSNYLDVKHTLVCASGTDALVMALMALGVKPGDAVFVPSFTFFATAECVSNVGATPIFVDIDADSLNMSPTDLESKITEVQTEGALNPKGIIPVDLFGRLADYTKIEAIAKKYDLFVLEDACQGFGASNSSGKAGTFGCIAATSFFPAKPLGCYGDGGAVFTNDDELCKLLGSIRVHGQGTNKYDNVRIGINGRLDTLQAAVLLSKLTIFDKELEARSKVAQYYSEQLKDCLITPSVPGGETSAWAQYTLVAKDGEQRNKLLANLAERSIPTGVYYPIPIHKSKAYIDLDARYKNTVLPVTEDMAARVFSLPMHPYLETQTMDEIIKAVKESL